MMFPLPVPGRGYRLFSSDWYPDAGTSGYRLRGNPQLAGETPVPGREYQSVPGVPRLPVPGSGSFRDPTGTPRAPCRVLNDERKLQ